MIRKERLPNRPGTMRIRFSLPASIWADTIHLVGDFNNWSTDTTPLRLDDTDWSVTLDLDTDQAYEYRYLVNNDEWLSDWNADSTISEHNGLTTSVVMTYVSRQMPLYIRPSQRHEQSASVLALDPIAA